MESQVKIISGASQQLQFLDYYYKMAPYTSCGTIQVSRSPKIPNRIEKQPFLKEKIITVAAKLKELACTSWTAHQGRVMDK